MIYPQTNYGVKRTIISGRTGQFFISSFQKQSEFCEIHIFEDIYIYIYIYIAELEFLVFFPG